MTSSSHGRSRPSLLTAPPLTETEAAEGSAVLTEVPGPVGILLWETCRDLMAWVKTPPQRRAGLFSERAWQRRTDEIIREIYPDRLRDALLALTSVLSGSSTTDSEPISKACEAVASWAEEHGNPATRLAFTQAAALTDPVDARLAFETGKQARDLAEYARAETWFRKAIQTARRNKDWENYLWAYSGLSVLYMRLGNYPASRTVMGRVLKTARHYRIRRMEGMAFHQFFILDAQSGAAREAYGHARSALQAYGSDRPRVTILAHDVARFWIEQGHFVRALSVFETTLPKISNPEEQAIAAANVARAAAATGNREKYEQAKSQAVTIIGQDLGRARSSEVYATLAFAAAYAAEWTLAEETADLALQCAIQLRSVDAWRFAEAAMRFARDRRAAQSQGEEIPTLARQADKLASDLIQSLQVTGAMAL